MNLAEKRVAVLGAGKMGGILVKAFLEKQLLSPALTTATVQHEERASALSKKLGIPVGTDNAAAAKDARDPRRSALLDLDDLSFCAA